jgi:hypothetical protein
MKKLIVHLIVVLCIFSIGWADDSGHPKLKEGFRDLKFGAKLSDVTELVADGKFQDYIIYKRPTDALALGNISLTSIGYWFWNGKLAAVNLEKKGTLLGDPTAIGDFLTSIYGKPTQIVPVNANGFSPRQIWEDEKTCIIYTCETTASYPLGTKIETIFIKSKDIESERARAQAEINSKLPNGL